MRLSRVKPDQTKMDLSDKRNAFNSVLKAELFSPRLSIGSGFDDTNNYKLTSRQNASMRFLADAPDLSLLASLDENGLHRPLNRPYDLSTSGLPNRKVHAIKAQKNLLSFQTPQAIPYSFELPNLLQPSLSRLGCVLSQHSQRALLTCSTIPRAVVLTFKST